MLWSERPSRGVRKWTLIAYWIVMYAGTHWPDIDDLLPGRRWWFEDADKVLHLFIYAGWIAMWWWLLSTGGRRISRSAMAWLIVGGLAYGIFDEATQAIVDRQPDVVDFLLDAAGLVVTVLILQYWQRRRLASPARPVRL